MDQPADGETPEPVRPRESSQNTVPEYMYPPHIKWNRPSMNFPPPQFPPPHFPPQQFPPPQFPPPQFPPPQFPPHLPPPHFPPGYSLNQRQLGEHHTVHNMQRPTQYHNSRNHQRRSSSNNYRNHQRQKGQQKRHRKSGRGAGIFRGSRDNSHKKSLFHNSFLVDPWVKFTSDSKIVDATSSQHTNNNTELYKPKDESKETNKGVETQQIGNSLGTNSGTNSISNLPGDSSLTSSQRRKLIDLNCESPTALTNRKDDETRLKKQRIES